VDYAAESSPLLTTGVPRICSHKQVDDHRKERKTTQRTIQQTKG